MKKYRSIILLGLCLVLASCTTTSDTATAPNKTDGPRDISNAKMKKIQQIIKKYTENHEDLSDPKVQSEIIKEVKLTFPIKPNSELDDPSLQEVAKEVRAKLMKKFPKSLKEIKQQAIAEAAKKDIPQKDKQRLVDEKVRDFYRAKAGYMNKLLNEHRETIKKANEKLGYIYIEGKWFTPENVVKKQITDILNPVKPVPATDEKMINLKEWPGDI